MTKTEPDYRERDRMHQEFDGRERILSEINWCDQKIRQIEVDESDLKRRKSTLEDRKSYHERRLEFHKKLNK